MKSIETTGLAFLVGAVMVATAPAAAQTAAPEAAARCTDDAPKVADLGIGIVCDCTVRRDRDGETWDFRSPITVGRVDPSGPAAGVLRTGDRIMAVDGRRVTSKEGAVALMRARPGQTLKLTIERDGAARTVSLTTGAICPDANGAIGVLAPAVPAVPAAPGVGARVTPGLPARPAAPGQTPRPQPVPTPSSVVPRVAPAPRAVPTPPTGVTPAPDVPRTAPIPPAPGVDPAQPLPPVEAAIPALPDLQPAGRLGFALSCSRCNVEKATGDVAPRWQFTSPPELYGLEPDGPADRAGLQAGDRILAINGAPITSDSAGRALGAVRPGQRLRLRVRRGDATREFVLVAGERPMPEPVLAPVAPRPSQARYRGHIGDVDVRVDGTEPVRVEVDPASNAIVIRTGGNVVRLTKDD